MLMLLFGFIGLMLDLALSMVYFVIKIALYLCPIVFIIYLIRNSSRRDY